MFICLCGVLESVLYIYSCFLPLLEHLMDEDTFHGLAKFSDQKP